MITDVARPLDLPPEEVAKRPDVLVIESGEIELPTKVRGMKSIGLPNNVIYACLAETIVLALEGRFEVFTIGRDTEWEKVKEIYKLGIKHGMKLAAISGVKGVYSDDDIAKVVTLAKKARRTWSVPADVLPATVAKTSRKGKAAKVASESEVVAPMAVPAKKRTAKVASKPVARKTAAAKTTIAKTIAAKPTGAKPKAIKARSKKSSVPSVAAVPGDS